MHSKFFPLKDVRINWNLLMSKTQCHLHFIIHLVKEDKKKQSPRHNKQPEAYITNNQYKKPLVRRKTRIVPGRRTYSEATKFGKKICVIGDSHLHRIKRDIFQKSVNGRKTYFNASKSLYPTKFSRRSPWCCFATYRFQ